LDFTYIDFFQTYIGWGDEETYTSDSTGMASAGFKRDSMPGDEKGNLILVVRVEDNDNSRLSHLDSMIPRNH
jgi:hypothetical protein